MATGPAMEKLLKMLCPPSPGQKMERAAAVAELCRCIDFSHSSLNTLGFSDNEKPSAENIKKAYRLRALLMHPDKAEAKDSALYNRLFLKLQEAHDDLVRGLEAEGERLSATGELAQLKEMGEEDDERALHARNVKFREDLREARAEALRCKRMEAEKERERLEKYERKGRKREEYAEEAADKEAKRQECLSSLVVDVQGARKTAKQRKKSAPKAGSRADRLADKRAAIKKAHEEHKKVWTPERKAEVKAARLTKLEEERQKKEERIEEFYDQPCVLNVPEKFHDVGGDIQKIQEAANCQWRKALLSGAPKMSISLKDKARWLAHDARRELIWDAIEAKEQDEMEAFIDARLLEAGWNPRKSTMCGSFLEAEAIEQEIRATWQFTERPEIGYDKVPKAVAESIKNGDLITVTAFGWAKKSACGGEVLQICDHDGTSSGNGKCNVATMLEILD